jgi:hypothetical protein
MDVTPTALLVVDCGRFPEVRIEGGDVAAVAAAAACI